MGSRAKAGLRFEIPVHPPNLVAKLTCSGAIAIGGFLRALRISKWNGSSKWNGDRSCGKVQPKAFFVHSETQRGSFGK
jgi:hypothetical protein